MRYLKNIRYLKIPIFSLLLLMSLGGFARAQIIDCDAIGESPFDTLRVMSKQIGSGDTVAVPLLFKNQTGVATFQFYLEFDSTFMKPLVVGVDSLYDDLGNFLGQVQKLYDYDVHGRLLYTEWKIDDLGFSYLDTTTNVQVVDEVDLPGVGDLQRIKVIGAFEDLFNPEEIIAPGVDTIMFILFEVGEGYVNGVTSTIDFYTDVIETRDTAFPFPIIRTDCLYSRYGDVTGLTDVRISTRAGLIQINNDIVVGDPPVINSFTATPSTIQSGGSSQLAWNVTSATNISIDNGVGSFTAGVGSTSVSPTATTTYTLTATNAYGQVQAFTTVTVGVVGNNDPVVNQVVGSPFTVNQGESVGFSVTATDIDSDDIITLSATSLPPGASFNQVVGSSSVTGNFSWTPDFATSAGTYVANFRATDNKGGTSNTVSVSITVIEIQNDILFSTSKLGQQPVGGLKGTEAVYFPINLVTSQTVYGVQFDFFYDPLYFEVDSFIVTGRTVDYVVYDDIGSIPGQVKVFTFGLGNEPVQTIADTTAILYAVMSIDSSAPPGDYPIYFENGWESVNPDPNVPGLALVVDNGVIQVDKPGDVNLDKEINVADLVNIVASIINNFTLSNRQFDAADVIVNEIVDVFDLVGVINMIFGLPVSPVPSFENETGTVSLAYSDLQAGFDDMLQVNSELPVEIAAAEIVINYNPSAIVLGKPSLSDEANGMSINYNDDKIGNLKVLMNFTNPFNSAQRIPSGDVSLLNIPMIAMDEIIWGDKSQLKITKALFSTSDAVRVEVDGVDEPSILPESFMLSQNYPNPFNPITKIDFSLDVATEVKLNIYNILGQQVRSLVNEYLPAGVHSIEWNATDDEGRPVSTGIYLYRIQVDQKTQSKKMLFLK